MRRTKFVADWTLPLTAARAVDVLITDRGVFRFADGAMTLTKTMPDISLEEIRANTDADFAVAL